MTDDAATARLREAMPLCALLQVRAEAYAAEEVVLALDWSPSLCTTNGVMHGGAVMALSDSAGGACAMLNLPGDATGTATIESKTNFLRPVGAGTVTATSRPLHRGGTTIVVETVLHDSAGRLVAKTTQTQIVLRSG